MILTLNQKYEVSEPCLKVIVVAVELVVCAGPGNTLDIYTWYTHTSNITAYVIHIFIVNTLSIQYD